MEDALLEAKALAGAGVKEIVLTGIHVTSYGQDHKNSDLTGLLRRLHDIAGIERIRLGSLEPGSMDVGFLKSLKEMPKVCGHFHLSLQSGCDRTLARMERRYSSSQYRETVLMMRGIFPLLSLTTDMIAGFPGETDEDFNQSLEFAREMGFAKIHAFPYSAVRGTKAAAFPEQIPRDVKARRAAMLAKTGEETGRAYRSLFVGKSLRVLFEREASAGVYEGLSENYMRIRAPSEADLSGRMAEARVVSAGGAWAEAERVFGDCKTV
jgi:threonylcarbamoyladenosine tRNA methylthiotransferase MtaB